MFIVEKLNQLYGEPDILQADVTSLYFNNSEKLIKKRTHPVNIKSKSGYVQNQERVLIVIQSQYEDKAYFETSFITNRMNGRLRQTDMQRSTPSLNHSQCWGTLNVQSVFKYVLLIRKSSYKYRKPLTCLYFWTDLVNVLAECRQLLYSKVPVRRGG